MKPRKIVLGREEVQDLGQKGSFVEKMRIKKIIFFLLLGLSLEVFLPHCKDGSQVKGVSVEVSFSEAVLTDNLLVDMEYKWRTKKNYVQVEEKCSVFVHFWHRSNLLFYDNHLPEIPPSRWEPEKEYIYTRRIYFPRFIDARDPEFKGREILRLSVGFAFPSSSPGKPLRKIFERKLKVFPHSGTPDISFEAGLE